MPPDPEAPAPLPPDMLARAFESALAADPPEATGSNIGPYKLLQEIGEGGFGTVWMAEQQEPIRRRVALKIIKLGMDTREVIARFEAERQALALMDHPNIARVFDAGATDAGRPFFVMELVRGVAITHYCDDNRLSPEARLRLFITVCQAVQHAHQKGVIHRDLKPSNILVTLHDGVPVPKIIDFGIAKATSAQLTDKTIVTQFHAFIGTPAYTSPEQMEMSGLDVDTRSDIYSLGVLLYELLTGRPPFDPDALAKSGLDAMRRTIREVDPPRPSARLGTLSHVDRTSVAHQRGTESGKLSLLLRGDLDWIVMRCLEKDRTRRYETANGLAVDVQRHLASEPVAARPASSAYRARKYIHRHKLGFAAAAAVAVSVVAGLIISSVLLVRERVAHARASAAEHAEGELRRQAETARVEEIKRAARTALDLADRNLTDGKVADGLAYLVYAARKDPQNPTLAPRLASVLTSRNYLLPLGAPFACESQVLAVRFSADGRSIFVGCEDGTFRALDVATGDLRQQFATGQQVDLDGWKFARNNEAIVGARCSNNTFAVFDLETGRSRFAPLHLDPLVWNHSENIGLGEGIALSPDGRWIRACTSDSFWLWDATNGELRLHPTSLEKINDADIRADGHRLAVVAGTSVLQWSLPDGAPLPVAVKYERDPARDVSAQRAGVRYFDHGRRLAVCDATTGILLYDADTGKMVKTLESGNDFLIPPTMVQLSPEHVFASCLNTSGTWDLRSGAYTPLKTPAGEKLHGPAFDATGRRALMTSDDRATRVVDLATGASITEPTWRPKDAFCAALSPDGTHVVVGTAGGMVYRLRVGRGSAQPLVLPRPLALRMLVMPAPFLPEPPARLLWFAPDRAWVIDVASGRTLGGFAFPDSVRRMAQQDLKPPVRPDLKYMVVLTSRGGWQSWEFDLEGIKRVVPLQEEPPAAGVIEFSPTEDRVSISTTNDVRIWDLRTGEAVSPRFTHPSFVVYLTPNFSPDGRRLALGTADGSAMVLDVNTARTLVTFDTRPQVPNHRVQFSPDGTRILTTNIRSEVRVWDAATGDPISPSVSVTASHGPGLFSRDGRLLAVWGESDTSLRDGRTGEQVGRTIPAGGKAVRFSADGRRLATGERAGNAQVWDIPSGEAVTEPMPHQPQSAFLPEFSPDGRFLRTENSRFHLWSLPPRLPDGVPTPEWLLELATICAMKKVDDTGQLVDAMEAIANVGALRRQIAALPGDDPFAEWGRWVLDDRASRPIAPGFTITPAEAEALQAEYAAAVAEARANP